MIKQNAKVKVLPRIELRLTGVTRVSEPVVLPLHHRTEVIYASTV